MEIQIKKQQKRANILALIIGVFWGIFEGISFYNSYNSLVGLVIISVAISAIIATTAILAIWLVCFAFEHEKGRKICRIAAFICFWTLNIIYVGTALWIIIKNWQGLNTGWLAPALANPNHITYGWETLVDSFAMIVILLILTVSEKPLLLALPAFQIIYLLDKNLKIQKIKETSNGR